MFDDGGNSHSKETLYSATKDGQEVPRVELVGDDIVDFMTSAQD